MPLTEFYDNHKLLNINNRDKSSPIYTSLKIAISSYETEIVNFELDPKDVICLNNCVDSQSLLSLLQGECINNIIINKFHHIISTGYFNSEKIYPLSTFFFSELQASPTSHECQRFFDPKHIKRYLNNININNTLPLYIKSIFEFDLLFIPVFMRGHWTCAIFNFNVLEATYYDSLKTGKTEILNRIEALLNKVAIREKRSPFTFIKIINNEFIHT